MRSNSRDRSSSNGLRFARDSVLNFAFVPRLIRRTGVFAGTVSGSSDSSPIACSVAAVKTKPPLSTLPDSPDAPSSANCATARISRTNDRPRVTGSQSVMPVTSRSPATDVTSGAPSRKPTTATFLNPQRSLRSRTWSTMFCCQAATRSAASASPDEFPVPAKSKRKAARPVSASALPRLTMLR